MFEHSVKVPRHYKIAANIFKKVSTEGGSVKTLLYDDKLRHFRTNVLYALITETIKHAADLDKLFKDCNLLENESRLDPWLAKVLATELLYGKKTLPGKSKPEQTIVSYKEQFETFLNEHSSELTTEAVRRPRYVRINTNLLTTSDAIGAFQEEGYRFIRCTSGPYNDYLKQISALTEYDFTQDYHVKTVFVFSPGTKLHEHDLYLESKIILQDKATALAVHLLCPPPDSVALDMCAAPGMKTTQLAAFMRNQGKIYAVERNEQRYQTLCEFVERTGSKCVETLHKDSLEIKRGEMDNVEYILLDPSCSGSGMELCVHNYIEESRLAKLTSLQEKFLKHAMNAFPKAKKIVYSTCSLYPEENERVITNVVKTSRAKWRVQDVKELLKGQWNNFGSGMYGSMGTRCLYAKPDTDFTTGFFLAVLERDAKDLEKSLGLESVDKEEYATNEKKKLNNGEIDDKKSRKRHKIQNETDQVVEEEEAIPEEDVIENGNKKIRKEYKNETQNDQAIGECQNEEGTTESFQEIKKKRKKNKSVDKTIIETNCNNNDDVSSETKSKHKKKKDKNTKDESLNELNGKASITCESTNVSEEKRSKKKKKDKTVTQDLQIEDIMEESNENGISKEDVNDFQVQSSHKKKKKEKKHKTDSNDEDPTSFTNNIDESSLTELKTNHEIDEPAVKKSKKKIRNLVDDSQEIDVVVQKKKGEEKC